jgi:hypothetical protein
MGERTGKGGVMNGLGWVEKIALGFSALGAYLGTTAWASSKIVFAQAAPAASQAAPTIETFGQTGANAAVASIVLGALTIASKALLDLGSGLKEKWRVEAERHQRELADRQKEREMESADKQRDREFRLELEKQATARHEFRDELNEMKVLASSLAAIVAPLIETVEINRKYLEKLHDEQGIPLPEGFRQRPFDNLLPRFHELIERVKDEGPPLEVAAKEVLSKGVHPSPGTRPPSSDDIPRSAAGTDELRTMGHGIPKSGEAK